MSVTSGREHGDVRGPSRPKRAPGDVEDPRRVDRQQLDQPAHGDEPGVEQAVQRQRHRRLEADDAKGRAVELHVLLVGLVRRVVGGDGVHRPVRRPCRSASTIAPARAAAGSSSGSCRTRSGPTSRSSVRVKWCGATSHVTRAPRALAARTARRACRVLRCAMWTALPVISASAMSRSTITDSAAAGMPRRPEDRRDVALVRDPLALQGRLLAVVDDGHVEHAGVLQRPAHQEGRGTGRPSSEIATQPASRRSAISASCSPFIPFETAPIG